MLDRAFFERIGAKRVQQRGSEVKMCCPFHNETKPSFYFNSTTHQYNCFACHEKGVGIERLLILYNVDLNSLGFGFYRDCIVPDKFYTGTKKNVVEEVEVHIKDSELDRFVDRYPSKWVEWFGEKLLRKYEIKYDERGKNIVFPVRNLEGYLTSIIGKPVSGAYKSVSYITKYKGILNLNRLINRREIILVEGLRDWLAMQKNGIDCACLMGSILTYKMLNNDLKPFLKQYGANKIVLGLDNDDAGRRGYTEIVEMLLRNKMFREEEIYKICPQQSCKDWMEMEEKGYNFKPSLENRVSYLEDKFNNIIKAGDKK